MSDEPCDGCPSRATHFLCDACCDGEVDALRTELAATKAERERLREALKSFPAQDVVPFVHEDGSTVRWVAALVRFEKLRLAALTEKPSEGSEG